MTGVIEELDGTGLDAALGDLADVLHGCVHDGASIGFLLPFPPAAARAFWTGVRADVASGNRVLLVARTADGRVAGTVQIVLATPANGSHRAEIGKLLVHPGARRGGIGRRLMTAAEDVARRHGRTLLVLDTRRGDSGERLYTSLQYRAAGLIPGYARSPEGLLEDTVVMYKALRP